MGGGWGIETEKRSTEKRGGGGSMEQGAGSGEHGAGSRDLVIRIDSFGEWWYGLVCLVLLVVYVVSVW
jgi:hypothetical protein